MTEIPEIDLQIETVEITTPSRYMGWWCDCGEIHVGRLKHSPQCVRCGAPGPERAETRGT